MGFMVETSMLILLLFSQVGASGCPDVQINIDYPGNDLNAGGLHGRVAGHLANAEACRVACMNFDGCVGYTFVKSEPAGTDNCAVKSSWNEAGLVSDSCCDSQQITSSCGDRSKSCVADADCNVESCEYCMSDKICREYDSEYCDANLCGHGDGDCDSDSQCKEGLVCGRSNFHEFHPSVSTVSPGADVCYKSGDSSKPCVTDADCNVEADFYCMSDKICRHYDSEYCDTNMCGHGDGDCGSDSQCKEGLVCGLSNFHNFHPSVSGVSSRADVCYKSAMLELQEGYEFIGVGYCRPGDCDVEDSLCRVIGMRQNGFTQSDCANECESRDACVGFAIEVPGHSDDTCRLYGDFEEEQDWKMKIESSGGEAYIGDGIITTSRGISRGTAGVNCFKRYADTVKTFNDKNIDGGYPYGKEARYTRGWALSNGIGDPTKCDELCQQQPECHVSGQTCKSTAYPGDNRCYCSFSKCQNIDGGYPYGKEARYTRGWALSNGLGDPTKCDELCQQQPECHVTGQTCKSAAYPGDNRCYCLFGESRDSPPESGDSPPESITGELLVRETRLIDADGQIYDQHSYVLQANDKLVELVDIPSSIDLTEDMSGTKMIVEGEFVGRFEFSVLDIIFSESSHHAGAAASGEALGAHTVVVVRVVVSDSEPTLSEDELKREVFGIGGGDALNLNGYEKCSYGVFTTIPFPGSTVGASHAVVDGVMTMTFSELIAAQQSDADLRHRALTELGLSFSSGQTDVDHVILVLPPGIIFDVIAYAYTNHWLSVFNDNWVGKPSTLLHELGHNLGLMHSNEGSVAYGDQTCLMGVSYAGDEGPEMCFNNAKNWELGWYADRRDVVDVSQAVQQTFNLVGISEYESTTADQTVVLKIGETHFAGFNRKSGINAGVMENPNLVTVHYRKTGDLKYSFKVAHLGAGESYLEEGEGWTITVDQIDLSSTPAVATITVGKNPLLASCSNPTRVHGGMDSRTRYQDATVNAPASCVSQDQVRICTNGEWGDFTPQRTPIYTNAACTVIFEERPRAPCSKMGEHTTSCWDRGHKATVLSKHCRGGRCDHQDARTCCKRESIECYDDHQCCAWGTTCNSCPDGAETDWGQCFWKGAARCKSSNKVCAKRPGECCYMGSSCNGCPFGDESTMQNFWWEVNVCGMTSRRCKLGK